MCLNGINDNSKNWIKWKKRISRKLYINFLIFPFSSIVIHRKEMEALPNFSFTWKYYSFFVLDSLQLHFYFELLLGSWQDEASIRFHTKIYTCIYISAYILSVTLIAILLIAINFSLYNLCKQGNPFQFDASGEYWKAKRKRVRQVSIQRIFAKKSYTFAYKQRKQI